MYNSCINFTTPARKSKGGFVFSGLDLYKGKDIYYAHTRPS